MIDLLLNPKVQKFLAEHFNDDPYQLALKYNDIDGVDIKIITEQIEARQKALKKFATLAGQKEILFPDKLAVEQASSFETARYKAELVKGDRIIDLTGGLGIDSLHFSDVFKEVTYLEKNETRAILAQHNFNFLGNSNIKTIISSAEKFLSEGNKADVIFLDPDRRPGKSKVSSFEDSSPNIIELKPQLLQAAKTIMVKASPMMDISAGIQALENVSDVHVVAVNNECKEILFILSESAGSPDIYAVNITEKDRQIFQDAYPSKKDVPLGKPENFLYEPNSAILKAGIQDKLTSEFNIKKLHNSTQLYTSDELRENFPGRTFHIKKILPVNRKAVKEAVPSLKANLSTRNFPEHVDKLKAKLKLTDGGEDYIFACRLQDLSYKLILTQKI